MGAAQTSRSAAILRLWIMITGIRGKEASAARIGMGVDRKQLETHRWTWCQNTSIFEYIPLLGTNRSAPYSRIGRRSATASQWARCGERPEPAGESLFTMEKAAWASASHLVKWCEDERLAASQ